MSKTAYVAELKRPLRKVGRVVELGHRHMPIAASIIAEPRLIICIKGTAHYLRPGSRTPTILEMKAGEGLYVAPGRWVRAAPRRSYACVGVIFYPDFIRLYRACFTGGKSAENRAVIQDELVVPVAPGEDVLRLCGLLESDAFPELRGEYATALGEYLCRITRALLIRPSQASPGKAYLTWQAARFHLGEHLHENLDRQRIADHLRIHPNHLSRLCIAFERESFAHFVQSQRLDRAQLLLTDPSLNVAEIAQRCGFGSASYFIRLFHRRFGRTPVEFRRRKAASAKGR